MAETPEPHAGAAGRPRPQGGEVGLRQALRAVELARAKKADDLVLLDLRSLSTVADYFLLASGHSEVQVKAIADHVQEELRKQGIRPWHVEGEENRRWILLDYVDWVLHVFHHETRSYYLLERLWGDAGRVPLPEE